MVSRNVCLICPVKNADLVGIPIKSTLVNGAISSASQAYRIDVTQISSEMHARRMARERLSVIGM